MKHLLKKTFAHCFVGISTFMIATNAFANPVIPAIPSIPGGTVPGAGSAPASGNNLNSVRKNLQSFGEGAYGQATQVSPVIMVSYIINSILGLSGILLVCYLVYGGFKWMTANGENSEIDRAKSIIRNAIIGLTIAAISFSISIFVTDELVYINSVRI